MSKSENGKIHAPRLCHVIKKDDFDGYGFNLHAEKGKPGQYIGKVDDGSPAESAGLKQGDRIIEVNGVNIGSETHKQVVQRIKAIASEVQLLVVDPSVAVTKDNRLVDPPPRNGSVITTTTTLPSTVQGAVAAATSASSSTSSSPVAAKTNDIIYNHHEPTVMAPASPTSPKPTSTTTSQPQPSATPDILEILPISSSTSSSPSPPPPKETVATSQNNVSTSPASKDRTDSKSVTDSPKSINNVHPITLDITTTSTITINNNTTNNHQSNNISMSAAESTTTTTTAATTTKSSGGSGGLNLNMTAAELRAKLAAKKKYDPKTESVDLRKKFEIVQKL